MVDTEELLIRMEEILDEKLDKKLDEKLDKKLDEKLDKRFEEFEERLDKKFDTKLDALEERINNKFYLFEHEYGTKIDAIYDAVMLEQEKNIEKSEKIRKLEKRVDRLEVNVFSHEQKISNLKNS